MARDDAAFVRARRARAGEFDVATKLYSRAILSLATAPELGALSNAAAAPDSEALHGLRQRGVAFELAGVLHNYACCVLEKRGDAPLARQLLHRATTACDAVDDPERHASCSENIGRLLSDMRDAESDGAN